MSAIEHRRTRVPGKVDAAAERVLTLPPVAGYCLWLAARLETAYNDGDAVGTWTDQSGNGHDATQATAAAKPTYKTGILNDKAVLRFDGGDTLLLGDLSSAVPTAATLFVVATITSSSYNLYTTHQTAQADIWWSFGGAGYYGPFRTGRYSNWPNPVPTLGSHLFVVKSATGTGTYEVIIDSVSKGTQDATHAGGPYHAISYDKRLTGDIAEIIMYPSALSSGDIADVEAYLNDLYGIW